jgi:hypothetical protein
MNLLWNLVLSCVHALDWVGTIALPAVQDSDDEIGEPVGHAMPQPSTAAHDQVSWSTPCAQLELNPVLQVQSAAFVI